MDAHIGRRIRDFALGLPEAWEDHPWGESVIKVGKKVFVFLGNPDAPTAEYGFSVKLPHSFDDALTMPFTRPTGYGLERGRWVTVMTPPDVPLEMLLGWVEESYRAVAPKALAASLGGDA